MTESFLGTLASSFFRWWWAAITGIASILSLFVLPDTVQISKYWVLVFILLFSVSIFLTVSVVFQGWLLFKRRLSAGRVVGAMPSKDHDGEFIFLIENMGFGESDKLVELRRNVDGTEVPFAVVRLGNKNVRQIHQATPIWISPIHKSELRKGTFSVSEIIVEPIINLETIEKLLNDRIAS